MQFDEKWSFVALDHEYCFVVSVVPGARTTENTEALVNGVHRRTGGRLLDLITRMTNPDYESAVLPSLGETITPPRTGKPGRPLSPHQVAPE